MRLDALTRDAALALRLLRRSPAFSLIALFTLALGVGAPTAIFSVVHAVLLRPLPYPAADRIVTFRIEARTPRGPVGFDALPASTALAWGASSTSLASIALYNDSARTVMAADGPVRLTGAAATPTFFEILAVPPLAGRTFAADRRTSGEVVLAYDTWHRLFGGRTAVLGTSVHLDGVPHEIVGVMPDRFDFPSPETAYWTPLILDAGGTRGMLLPAIARLAPGAPVAAVAAEGLQQLRDEEQGRAPMTLLVRTLQDQMVGRVRRILWVLMGAVSLVSLIATANIALLLLTRGAHRTRELALRLALGAGRARLVQQLFVEASVLAALGGLAGLVLAAGAIEGFLLLAPPELPRVRDAGLDARVLAFTAALVVLASLALGSLAAWKLVGVDAQRELGGRGGQPGVTAAALPRRRLNLLAASEITLATVLLVGAGLLLRSFIGLVLADQGFDSRGALAARVTLPASRYPTPDARMTFHERLLARLQALEGASHAGLITSMPNRQPTGRFAYDEEGIPLVLDPFSLEIAEVRMATEGFLEAMGIPLVAGRTFTAADTQGADPVIVISRSLARRHFGAHDPIGRMLYSASGNRRVVGLVEDVRPAASTGISDPSAYLPLRQKPDVFLQFATMNVVVRGADPIRLARELRSIVLSLDPELPLFDVRTVDAEVAGLVAGPRFTATMLGLFASVALVMAALGVYGVIAYSAGRRTREIGVRIAVGATRGQVMRLVLRDGLAIVAIGLATGLAGAVWLARGLTGLLHEVTPADPVALVSVGAVLGAAGLAAAIVPAWRATRVSALQALRDV
jgi:predicted permease